MYPQLINQASRLAPMLSRFMSRGGSFATPFWKTQQVEAPEVVAQPVTPNGPSVPISGPQSHEPQRPTPPISGPQATPMPPVQGLDLPWMPPMPRARPPEASMGAAPAPAASTPMPQARPAEAPAPEPDTSFFMRNALMMHDPNGGGLIDPMGAASVRGPDLINKMMGYLHNKVS